MSVKKMVTIAILCSMAIVSNMIFNFPLVAAVPFMKYDPKDIIIVIAGFIYGPLVSVGMSFITSVLEILYHGGNYIDVIMNVISTCAFVCPAALIYKKIKSKKGAVIGLISGVMISTLIMLLWNYIVTPGYYKLPREAVVELMIPGILPFNLIKNVINAVLAFILYKPIVTIFRSTSLLEKSEKKAKISVGLILISIFILVTVVLLLLVINGKL